MIDLISYDFQPDIQNDLFYVHLKYTDEKKDTAWVSGEMMSILEKDEILELLKGLHKV
jgi:hypothetical protein